MLGSLTSYFDKVPQFANSISRVMVSSIGERVRQILIELDLFFPDEKRGLVKKQAFTKNENSGMMIEMERMIVKKSRVYDLHKQEF